MRRCDGPLSGRRHTGVLADVRADEATILTAPSPYLEVEAQRDCCLRPETRIRADPYGGPTSEFVVRSSRRSDQLQVWIINAGYQWRARIDFGDLTAEATVYERYSGDALRLDRYFGDLAAHWRGWDGDKEWEALGLRLVARPRRAMVLRT